MRLCLSPQSSRPCQRRLPCPLHGTRIQPIGAAMGWLIEPVAGGALVTLTRDERRLGTTRWCASDDGEDGLRRLQDFLLQEACVQ